MIDRRIHVLCPHGSSPRLPGIVVHRCRRIDPVDIVSFEDGVRLTSPPRTLFDSSSIIGLRDTVSVIELFLEARICTLGTLWDTTERLFHPRRPGSLVMRQALSSRPPWRAAMQSDLEVQVFDAVVAAGLPQPVPQCAVTLDDGAIIHVDLGWPDYQVALEVDCPYWHDGAEASRRDKMRDLDAAVIGWQTGRITMPCPAATLVETVQKLRRVLELRGWAPDRLSA